MAANFDEGQVRQTLMDELNRLNRQIGEIKHGDESPFPDQPEDDLDDLKGDEVEQAEPLTDAEREQDILDALEVDRLQVQAALKRLDDGTYGLCARCSKPIDPRRLATHPWLLYDLQCQQDIESGRA